MELQHFLQAVNSTLKMANQITELFVYDQTFHFLHLKLIAYLEKTQQ